MGATIIQLKKIDEENKSLLSRNEKLQELNKISNLKYSELLKQHKDLSIKLCKISTFHNKVKEKYLKL